MKLVVLGASGGTGKQLVQQGLDRGHLVTAVVRQLKSIIIDHENLKASPK